MKKSNHKELQEFLHYSKQHAQEKRLRLEGWWTYDNDYFSIDYLGRLLTEKVIVINRNLGKKVNPNSFDTILFVSKMQLHRRIRYKGKPDLIEKPGHIVYVKAVGNGLSYEIDLGPTKKKSNGCWLTQDESAKKRKDKGMPLAGFERILNRDSHVCQLRKEI